MKTPYEENAFRILGLPANATWKAIRAIQNKLKLRAKVGGLQSMDDPLFFLNAVERNESTIRDAFNRLDRPETRLLERLFWFTESNPADAKAISQLVAGEFLESIEIWQSAKFISARTNLARLLHAVAVMRDPNAEDILLWKNAFESWRLTLENNAFWKQFVSIEEKSGVEPVADTPEFEDLREKSWEIILEPSTGLLQKALDQSQYNIAARHLDLIRHSGFPNQIIANIEAKVFERLENRIEETAANIIQTLSDTLKSTTQSSEKKNECDHAYQRYKSELLPKVKRLAQLANVDSETTRRVCENAASCLRSIAINYHNDAEDFQSSEQMLKEALALSKNSFISERIKQDLATVSKHAQESEVWKNIKPINKAPTLHTINGIGTKLYGRTDHDPATDSYIATLYFVVLFIPVFPIRRYRIKDEGNNTYRFLGKAALRSFDKLHRGIALFLVGLFFVMSSLDSGPTSSVSPTRYTKPTNPTPYSISPNTTLDRTNTENYDLKAQIERAKAQLSIKETELQQLSDKIDSYKRQFVSYARKIQQIEDDIEAGYSIDQQDYEDTVNRHNYYVKLYKSEFSRYDIKYAEYKRLHDETKAKIDEYNRRR